MRNEMVSVIMSAYNERKEELQLSIGSLIGQTYQNLEIIIINDNPLNLSLKKHLLDICKDDTRIKLYNNVENLGLVESLNRALTLATGSYIARMDADDISEKNRIKNQMDYLIEGEFDLVGSNIMLIDELNEPISELCFPANYKGIKRFAKWGTCLPHPTWLGKKRMFECLKGYRNIPWCEDYDFFLRALASGYVLGNLQEIGLRYRVRKTGISSTNQGKQKVMRCYLADNRNAIMHLSENDVYGYLISGEFAKKQSSIEQYEFIKTKLKTIYKQRKIIAFIRNIVFLLTNRWFYQSCLENLMIKIRGRY